MADTKEPSRREVAERIAREWFNDWGKGATALANDIEAALKDEADARIKELESAITALREQLAQERQRRIVAERAAEKWYHERY